MPTNTPKLLGTINLPLSPNEFRVSSILSPNFQRENNVDIRVSFLSALFLHQEVEPPIQIFLRCFELDAGYMLSNLLPFFEEMGRIPVPLRGVFYVTKHWRHKDVSPLVDTSKPILFLCEDKKEDCFSGTMLVAEIRRRTPVDPWSLNRETVSALHLQAKTRIFVAFPLG